MIPEVGFMDEREIQKVLSARLEAFYQERGLHDEARLKEIRKWLEYGDTKKGHTHRSPFVYGHREPVGGVYNCNTISDEWFQWFLTNPSSMNPFTNPGKSYSNGNVFLLNKRGTEVYFAAASPFQYPDFRTITITKQAPLLVPVYNMSASEEDFPSKVRKTEKAADGELTNLILDDLSGVLSIEATFDKQPIHGCCVIRNRSNKFRIADNNNVIGIPEERLNAPNSAIHMCHGGYWLLIKENKITPGDHLLEFKAESKNYEIWAKILINALY